MRLFICGAKPEFEYIKNNFGYPEDNIKYLGFCRYDNLHNADVKKNRIVIMPTWREWLVRKTKHSYELDPVDKFINTEYFRKWSSFISSQKLKEIAEKYNLEIIFYPHRNMQTYISDFHSDCDHIHIANWRDWDLQDLLKTSAIMITDYSSVFFDFVYMKKPVIFYQFDIDKFRKEQYQQGYFDYFNNSFGKAYLNPEDVINKLEELIGMKGVNSEEFLNEHKKTFLLYDEQNCYRTYLVIKKLEIR